MCACVYVLSRLLKRRQTQIYFDVLDRRRSIFALLAAARLGLLLALFAALFALAYRRLALRRLAQRVRVALLGIVVAQPRFGSRRLRVAVFALAGSLALFGRQRRQTLAGYLVGHIGGRLQVNRAVRVEQLVQIGLAG